MERMPVEVTHLAEYIEDELKERGWSVRDLVFRMRRYEGEKDWAHNLLAVEMFMAVRDKRVSLGDMAEEFAAAFDVDPQLFTNLHQAWCAAQPEKPKKSRRA